MLRSLGARMEPSESQLGVASDLISVALVADSRRPQLKIDLFAPVELTFKHWDSSAQVQPPQQQQRCAFWDSSIR